MSRARVLTVGAAHVGARDDASGLRVARALLADGVPVASREVVDEDESALEAVLRARADDVRLTVILAPPGGSAGEIVRRTLSRVTGARLVLSERMLALLEDDFTRRGQAMPRRAERLALLPQGAQPWPAPAGEPGWALETADGLVAVLPLASAHLDHLVEVYLGPAARSGAGAARGAVLRTLRATGVSPGDVEERLGRWLGREGDVEVSCLPVEDDVWVRLLARAPTRALADAALAGIEADVRRELGVDCYGVDAEALEEVAGRLLAARGLTVSVAESCTGGLLAQRLTSVPGASRYFRRGVVAYGSGAKEDLLAVPRSLVETHGEVSAQVAEAMAAAVRRASGSACALAVTGLAGPDGGTEDKPVGTVFVAVVTPSGAQVRRFRYAGGRDTVRWRAAHAALDLLRRALTE